MNRQHRRSRFGLMAPLGLIAAIATGALAERAAAQGLTNGTADTILINGQILTVDNELPEKMTVAQAVAIQGNKIMAVGTTEEIRKLAGPGTRVIDLAGKSVMPGAIYSDGDNSVPGGDIHKESQWGGWIQPKLRDILKPGDKLPQAVAAIKEIIEKRSAPDEAVFIRADKLGYPEMQKWTRKDLDKWAPNKPLGLWFDSSNGVVNTKLLDMAVKEGLRLDHFGVIKDKDGQPTGQLGAQALGFVGYSVRPWPKGEWIEKVAIPDAAKTMQNFARAGVTVATGHMSGLTMTVMNRLIQEKQMAVRVYPAHDFIRQNPFGEHYLKRMGNMVGMALSDGRGPVMKIIATAVGPHSGSPNSDFGLRTIEPKKNMIPGLSDSPNGYDLWTTEVWTDKSTEQLTPQELRDTDYHNVMVARQHGWNLSGIHNMGSAALRLAIRTIKDAEGQQDKYVENMFAKSGFDHNIGWTPEVMEEAKSVAHIMRFSIALREAMLQRDNAILGIKNVLSLQYGEEGLATMAPLATLVKNGIPVHIEGSEPSEKGPYRWPTWYIEKAVTRVDERGIVVAKDEAVDRITALYMVTRWAARYISEDGNLGSIQPGMYADVAVLNGDFMKTADNKLSTLKPLLTMVGGNVEYVDFNYGKDLGLISATAASEQPRELTVDLARLVEIVDKGRAIVFSDPGTYRGEALKHTIRSELSAKRTKVTIAGTEAPRDKLQPGMSCKIVYLPGGKDNSNEPSLIACN